MDKQCVRCLEVKDTTEFPANKRNKDGLQGTCRECFNERQRAYYKRGGKAVQESYRSTERGNQTYMDAKVNYEKSDKGIRTRLNQKESKRKSIPRVQRSEENRKQQDAARNAVNGKIRLGHLQNAKSYPCYICGKPAQEYHHHKGYAKENFLDIMPVCIRCHRRLDTDNPLDVS